MILPTNLCSCEYRHVPLPMNAPLKHYVYPHLTNKQKGLLTFVGVSHPHHYYAHSTNGHFAVHHCTQILLFFLSVKVSRSRPERGLNERLYTVHRTLYLSGVNKEKGGLLQHKMKTFRIWKL